MEVLRLDKRLAGMHVDRCHSLVNLLPVVDIPVADMTYTCSLFSLCCMLIPNMNASPHQMFFCLAILYISTRSSLLRFPPAHPGHCYIAMLSLVHSPVAPLSGYAALGFVFY